MALTLAACSNGEGAIHGVLASFTDEWQSQPLAVPHAATPCQARQEAHGEIQCPGQDMDSTADVADAFQPFVGHRSSYAANFVPGRENLLLGPEPRLCELQRSSRHWHLRTPHGNFHVPVGDESVTTYRILPGAFIGYSAVQMLKPAHAARDGGRLEYYVGTDGPHRLKRLAVLTAGQGDFYTCETIVQSIPASR